MIKIWDGEIADILPPYLKRQPETQAFSYACKRAFMRMLQFAEKTRLYADIDHTPEAVLDYMALELDAQYYSESLDADTKRAVIKNALGWKMKAGTKAAVNELVETVFGESKVVEWNEFDPPGEPGVFDVITTNVLTQDALEEFYGMIDRVKNLTSHLRHVIEHHDMGADMKLGIGFTSQLLVIMAEQVETPDWENELIMMANETGEMLADEAGNILVDESSIINAAET